MMLKSILPKHKKGVSELISYTLLIILALTASVLVFNYIKVLVPKEKISCPDSSSLIMSDYKCKFNAFPLDSQLNITLINKGKFTIDGVYLRISDVNKTARKLINRNEENLVFNGTEEGLKPGNEESYSYNINSSSTDVTSAGDYSLEIQPAMIDDKTKKLAACSSFVQTITCN